jgi:uncharacterized protein (TIGR02996 family)
MAVHFVYRCPYLGPSERFVARFEDASVLDWFRNRWVELGERGFESGELPGVEVYGLGSLGEAIREHDLPAPASADELQQVLREHLYVEGEILFQEHCLQVLSDDDELQMAYFFFDEVWMAEHAERAAFLLHPGWELPTSAGPLSSFVPEIEAVPLGEAQEGEGTVWINLYAYYDGMNLDGGSPHQVRGLRMDELPAWLARMEPGVDFPIELRLLRSRLLQAPAEASPRERELLALLEADPADRARWAVYSDWLMEQGLGPAPVVVMQRALQACADSGFIDQLSSLEERALLGSLAQARAEADELFSKQGKGKGKGRRRGKREPPPRPPPKPGQVSCGPHLAQACLPVFSDALNAYQQWILFDDLWASAHPALARGVMRHVTRWDALTVD